MVSYENVVLINVDVILELSDVNAAVVSLAEGNVDIVVFVKSLKGCSYITVTVCIVEDINSDDNTKIVSKDDSIIML